MKAKINLLAIVDTKIDFLDQVKEALEMQRQDYLKGTDGDVDIETTIIREDLSGLSWVEYWGNNYGVNINWIREHTGPIKEKYGEEIHSIAYVIDWNNWTKKGNQNIWGWNLGKFYPDEDGYQIQLVRAGRNSVQAMYYTFLMELFHAMDDFWYRATRLRLEEIFNVTDFDEDVVHARHPDYEVFKYIPAIRQMKDALIELFRIKQKYMEDVILVFDPLTEKGSKDRKIYRLNNELMQRAHLNNPEYFEFTYGAKAWAAVSEISKEEFFFYREVGPAGFEQDFKSSWLQQIIKLISKKV